MVLPSQELPHQKQHLLRKEKHHFLLQGGAVQQLAHRRHELFQAVHVRPIQGLAPDQNKLYTVLRELALHQVKQPPRAAISIEFAPLALPKTKKLKNQHLMLMGKHLLLEGPVHNPLNQGHHLLQPVLVSLVLPMQRLTHLNQQVTLQDKHLLHAGAGQGLA
jgi:hypothetical protein